MSVIAWDGSCLAADKQATNYGYKFTVTKIKKINGSLCGGVGDFSCVNTMFDWIAKGSIPSEFPDIQKDKDKWSPIIMITPDKKIMKYEQSPVPFLIEDKKYAMGSGRDFALTAMELGSNSIESVLIASKFSAECGHGVDSIYLDDFS